MRAFSSLCISTIFLAGALIFQPNAVHAQTVDVDSRSMAFAFQSYRAWRNGDRATAIIEALKGLPQDPDAADIERFQAAWDALRLAVASRSFRIPFDGLGVFYSETDPTGRVTATVASWAEDTDNPYLGLNLWDPQTGAHIAELIPRSALQNQVYDSGPPVFSPDGSMVALTAPFTGQAHVFDSRTGQEIVVFGEPVNDPSGAPGDQVFSPDGTRFLVGGGSVGAPRLVDTATWDTIAVIGLPECLSIEALPGGRGSAIPVFLRSSCGPGLYGTDDLIIAEILPDGTVTTLFTTPRIVVPQGSESYHTIVTIDPTGRHFLVAYYHDEDEYYAIHDRTGSILGQFDGSAFGGEAGEFSRDGNALVLPYLEGPWMRLRGVDFDGTEYEPDISEILPFAHNLHSMGGRNIRGFGSSAVRPSYAGDDLPDGPEFYAVVWELLPAEVRALVDAERITID